MENDSKRSKLSNIRAFTESLEMPSKKLVTSLGIKAIYSLFITCFLGFLLIAVDSLYFGQRVILDYSFVTLLWLLYFVIYMFVSLNNFANYMGDILSAFVETFGSSKTKSVMKKDISSIASMLSLEKKRSISNFLKWISIGSFASGTIAGVLYVQQSFLGVSAIQGLLYSFCLLYFIGIFSFVTRAILLTNADWVIVNLHDFNKTENASCFKKALLSYNKCLGSTLSLKKLLVTSQYVTQAYRISTNTQKDALNLQITKICAKIKEKKIPETDLEIINLVKQAKEIIKEHNSVLGMSVRYPLKIMFWEQTKLSLAKNYPKLMYLILGIILLVALKQFNLLPEVLP